MDLSYARFGSDWLPKIEGLWKGESLKFHGVIFEQSTGDSKRIALESREDRTTVESIDYGWRIEIWAVPLFGEE
jgi:hypothetical protein